MFHVQVFHFLLLFNLKNIVQEFKNVLSWFFFWSLIKSNNVFQAKKKKSKKSTIIVRRTASKTGFMKIFLRCVCACKKKGGGLKTILSVKYFHWA